MGLIPAIIYGAAAIVGAALVKVIADDVKEWTLWVTRRLLHIAVRRLPEGQRERYAEEWAAHLTEVPGVVGKLAVSIQFQIAAFGARELEAKARLDAWRNEEAAILAGIRVMLTQVHASVEVVQTDDAAEDTHPLEEQIETMHGALLEVLRRWDELDTRRPALDITMAGTTLMAERIFGSARAQIMATTEKARNWPMYMRGGIFRMLGRPDQ